MKGGRLAATLVFTAIAATLVFWLVVHTVFDLWLDVAFHPEVRAAMEQSMADQRRLRDLDPRRGEEYRRSFERTRTLLARIDVIRMNRDTMLQRIETALVVLFGITIAAGLTASWLRAKRAEERKRREYASRLSTWQEAARRHAHELRTPLTAARLELDRLVSVAKEGGNVEEAQESVIEELERLTRFTREYASFGSLSDAVLREEDLGRIVEEFGATFAAAWPGMVLVAEKLPRTQVCADRDLVRQVLVNLCANSTRAGAKQVAFSIDGPSLDVRDDGAGIAEELRSRIFDPYVTTTKPGEGMGLGLPISRKIMLDHGGDLVLVATSQAGTAFRLTFGERSCN